MLYSVIYSVDTPRGEYPSNYFPPEYKTNGWDITERGFGGEYTYLGGDWASGAQHYKFCGMLTQEQFDKFVSWCELIAEDVKTMGSLGAPGFGWGWAPAVSFRGEHYNAITGAYVTPCLDNPGMPSEWVSYDWETIRQHVIEKYGG